MPYEYRRMTNAEREAVLKQREAKGYPLYAPPHPFKVKTCYLLTAANYEHQGIIKPEARLTEFQKLVFERFAEFEVEVAAWVFLHNHYHLLAFVPHFPRLSILFNRLHGVTSRQWNLEDEKVGRKVWYKYTDRMIRDERHYFATINYIHYNPVKHGYTKRADEWPWSSFHWYFEHSGRDWLVEIWKRYPIKSYGDKWDI